MPRPGVTYDQVVAVVEILLAEGKRPTLRGIRERLGSGSPNSIQEHLRTWEKSKPRPGSVALELSPGFLAAFTAEIERQRAAALTAVQTELSEQQERSDDLGKYANALEAERDQLKAQIEDLTTQRDRIGGELQSAKAQIEKLEAEVTHFQQAAEGTRIELAKTQLQLESFPALQAQVTDLRAENRELLQRATVAETRLEERQAHTEKRKA